MDRRNDEETRRYAERARRAAVRADQARWEHQGSRLRGGYHSLEELPALLTAAQVDAEAPI